MGKTRELVERALIHELKPFGNVASAIELGSILAAADALDARQQPTPITQEALRAAGWEIDVDADDWGNWTAFIMAGAMILDAEAVASDSVHISIMSGNTQTYLRHITTMQQLSQLVELLTGQPMPGEGARE